MRKMFLAAVLLAAPASAAERYTMIAGSFAMSGGPRPVIVAMSMPQIAPDSAAACRQAIIDVRAALADVVAMLPSHVGDGFCY